MELRQRSTGLLPGGLCQLKAALGAVFPARGGLLGRLLRFRAGSLVGDGSDSSPSLACSYRIAKRSSKEGELEKVFTPGNTHNKNLSRCIQHKVTDIKRTQMFYFIWQKAFQPEKKGESLS